MIPTFSPVVAANPRGEWGEKYASVMLSVKELKQLSLQFGV